jgi:transcriptional regulator with XRE-family HTH domain
MTTRGARIKRERNRRRQSRPDVARATGVSIRTIQRLENGELSGDTSGAMDVLEEYFGLDSISAGQEPEPDTDTGAPHGLSDHSLMELLAEAIRRVAQLEARTGEHFVGEPRRVRWKTADAPPLGEEQNGHSRDVR